MMTYVDSDHKEKINAASILGTFQFVIYETKFRTILSHCWLPIIPFNHMQSFNIKNSIKSSSNVESKIQDISPEI